jgi:hypothetical protein
VCLYRTPCAMRRSVPLAQWRERCSNAGHMQYIGMTANPTVRCGAGACIHVVGAMVFVDRPICSALYSLSPSGGYVPESSSICLMLFVRMVACLTSVFVGPTALRTCVERHRHQACHVICLHTTGRDLRLPQLSPDSTEPVQQSRRRCC